MSLTSGSGRTKKFEFFHWLTKNECAAEIKITKYHAFHFTSGPHSGEQPRAGKPSLARLSKNKYELRHPETWRRRRRKLISFPRYQCIACNDIIHDRNHPLLLFGSSQEAKEIRLNFENLTGITLNVDDPYPKKICLPCKIKLESAVAFKNLSVTSREAQEENLSHVKRGRSYEAESSSLSPP